MALMTYASEPFATTLPRLRVEDGSILADGREAYRAEQALQIAVLTDFCNECGNCVTACPTSGRPWRDKPRLYLDPAEFEAELDNAFMLFDDGSVEGRFGGQTHRLSVNGVVEYVSPSVSASFEIDTLALMDVTAGDGVSAEPSLRPAADMYVLWRGLARSMAHLPRSRAAAAAGVRIAHPGYEE